MKTTIKTIISVTSLFFLLVFAANTLANTTVLSCPATITCNYKEASCAQVPTNWKVFMNNVQYFEGDQQFIYASASASNDGAPKNLFGTVFCNYVAKEGNILLQPRLGNYKLDKYSSWIINNTNTRASCSDSNPNDCDFFTVN